jgi:uncharacterized protein
MVSPKEVKRASNRLENKNIKFRTYLKCHADEKTLDRQFLELHNELFSDYDCSQCCNCCKEYRGSFEEGEEEIAVAANHMKLTLEEFKGRYTEEVNGKYQANKCPCTFLNEEMECILGDAKPESCKKFPYTDQPERLFSLYGVLEFAGVCPVVFEILERLKKIYKFR